MDDENIGSPRPEGWYILSNFDAVRRNSENNAYCPGFDIGRR
jgi:hypothetical protein